VEFLSIFFPSLWHAPRATEDDVPLPPFSPFLSLDFPSSARQRNGARTISGIAGAILSLFSPLLRRTFQILLFSLPLTEGRRAYIAFPFLLFFLLLAGTGGLFRFSSLRRERIEMAVARVLSFPLDAPSLGSFFLFPITGRTPFSFYPFLDFRVSP